MRRFTNLHGRCAWGGSVVSSRNPFVIIGLASMQGLIHMAKTEGLAGMFKGNGANCVRIIPNSAVKFITYEHISR